MLTEQREAEPSSEYPLRWPLPFPVRDFVVRTTEEHAWVAEDHERLLGHVAVTGLGDLAPAFAAALDTDAAGLRAVSGLFTRLSARGTGLGARLLEVAVRRIRDAGHRPVLDVVPTHTAAVSLYRTRGWREVGRLRPEWLPPERPDLLLMTLDRP
ncbi:hypothetical protein GCM10028771_10300 [Nocardioides marmoraquaticus]